MKPIQTFRDTYTQPWVFCANLMLAPIQEIMQILFKIYYYQSQQVALIIFKTINERSKWGTSLKIKILNVHIAH